MCVGQIDAWATASAASANFQIMAASKRLFVEERRRLKIIPNAFGERVVLKLMFGALIRAAERWRSVKVTEFERRQMAAVRKELDEEYEASVGLDAQPSKDSAQPKISSNSRT